MPKKQLGPGQVDAECLKRLDRLNKQYRLGLSIDNWPTRLAIPKYADFELWEDVKREISLLHKTDRARLDAVLEAYEEWALKQQEKIGWVQKPSSDPRLLGEPVSHLDQLRRYLGISPWSTKRVRKIGMAGSDQAQSKGRESRSVTYPRLSETAQWAIAESKAAERFCSVSKDQLKSSQEKARGKVTERSSQMSDGGSTQLVSNKRRLREGEDDGPSAKGRKAFSSPSKATSVATGPTSREASFKSAFDFVPQRADRSFDSVATQDTALTKSFGSNGQDGEKIDTPATSFGSIVPVASFNTRKLQGVFVTKEENILPAESLSQPQTFHTQSQRLSSNSSSAVSDGFLATSSWEDAALDIEQGPSSSNLLQARGQYIRTTSNSQASNSTDYLMLEADRDRVLNETATKPAKGVTSNMGPPSSIPVHAQDGPASFSTDSSALDENRSCRESHKSSRQSSKTRRAVLSKPFQEAEATSFECEQDHPQQVDAPKSSAASSAGADLDTSFIMNGMSPLSRATWQPPDSMLFRTVYEVTRFALSSSIEVNVLLAQVQPLTTDATYPEIWRMFMAIPDVKAACPERSSESAWDGAQGDFDKISLGGKLSLFEEKGRLRFNFILSPLRKHPTSHRFGRKFGHDRFFVLDIPRFPEQFRQQLIDWLCYSKHRFLGRKWRTFFVKNGNSNKKTDIVYQAFLFAESGFGINQQKLDALELSSIKRHRLSHTRMLDWFLHFHENMEQKALKYFVRIGLGLTKTSASITFKPSQIIRTDDAWSCCPGVRRLDRNRLGVERHKHDGDGKVMNDGCGRISWTAAQLISKQLGLVEVPSAFQGRLGGGKGVWFVDPQNEKCFDDELPDIWIEMTNSQYKFEIMSGGPLHDGHQYTFDVHSYSHPVTPHCLSYTLVPILMHRGVPQNVFVKLLNDDMQRHKSDIMDAVRKGGLAFRSWIQSFMPVSTDRSTKGEIRMAGGMPDALAENMIALSEAGFHPLEDAILASNCYEALKERCMDLEKRRQIGLPRSTHILMIADPLNVLAEGEIHLHFSKGFQESEDAVGYTKLDNRDVLVTRFPAYLPHEVQRVRAVFKHELSEYKDVVVFSSRGKRSLADMLSGGDFDGDRAWVCWEPSLVEPFRNAPFVDPPPPEHYGIRIDKDTTRDFRQNAHGRQAFIHKGIDFNTRPPMLGKCADYFTSCCYHNSNDLDKYAHLGALMGHLVDTAKNGYSFDEEDWSRYRAKYKLPTFLDRPAWRTDENEPGVQVTDHILDQLRFVHAKSFREAALAEFHNLLSPVLRNGVPTYDIVLSGVYREEEREAHYDRDSGLKEILEQLKLDLENLFTIWSKKQSVRQLGKEEHKSHKKSRFAPASPPTELQFRALCDEFRSHFLTLAPHQGSRYPLADRWRREAAAATTSTCSFSSTDGSWTRLKASTLYHFLFKKMRFTWHVAGKELCEIKALATYGRIGTVMLSKEIYTALKVDKGYVRRFEGKAAPQILREGQEDQEDQEDE